MGKEPSSYIRGRNFLTSFSRGTVLHGVSLVKEIEMEEV
jgi:hypothetical protein